MQKVAKSKEKGSEEITLSISYRGVKFINPITKVGSSRLKFVGGQMSNLTIGGLLQNTICEHEIRNINCACQDSDHQCYFAYITKDGDSFYCHVFQSATSVSPPKPSPKGETTGNLARHSRTSRSPSDFSGSPISLGSPVSPLDLLYLPWISCISHGSPVSPLDLLYLPVSPWGFPWISLGSLGSPWVPLDLLVSPLNNPGSPYIPLGSPSMSLGSPCISLRSSCISLGSPWISMYLLWICLYLPWISLYLPWISQYLPRISPSLLWFSLYHLRMFLYLSWISHLVKLVEALPYLPGLLRISMYLLRISLYLPWISCISLRSPVSPFEIPVSMYQGSPCISLDLPWISLNPLGSPCISLGSPWISLYVSLCLGSRISLYVP
jgi:hypothetical protein